MNWAAALAMSRPYFPSFSEGLSLRAVPPKIAATIPPNFPSFSEGLSLRAVVVSHVLSNPSDFPSFSEGLSLRVDRGEHCAGSVEPISLPFRRDFH